MRLPPILFLLTLLAGIATPPAQAQAASLDADTYLVAGKDYVVIAGGQPFEPLDGKIEVVEVFGYTCPHCAHFQPLVDAWKAGLDDDVRLRYVPAPFGGHWIPYARAFYAAQALGLVERSHAAVFRALHDTGQLPISGATPREIATFYAGFGADPDAFAAAMTSDATDARLRRARQFLMASGVNATPSMLVNGKYRVLGNSFQELLDNTDALVEHVRATRAAAGKD